MALLDELEQRGLLADVTDRTALADLLASRLGPDGLTLLQANRPAGWQDVFHLHMHVIPRWEGDGLTPPWAPQPEAPEALAVLAERLARRPASSGS